MKTIVQALRDEVFYPVPLGYVENVLIRRGLNSEDYFTSIVAQDKAYRGALADCLMSLVQAINFSEADKSIGNLSDVQRKALLKKANALYSEIGEEEQDLFDTPTVYIGSAAFGKR